MAIMQTQLIQLIEESPDRPRLHSTEEQKADLNSVSHPYFSNLFLDSISQLYFSQLFHCHTS